MIHKRPGYGLSSSGRRPFLAVSRNAFRPVGPRVKVNISTMKVESMHSHHQEVVAAASLPASQIEFSDRVYTSPHLVINSTHTIHGASSIWDGVFQHTRVMVKIWSSNSFVFLFLFPRECNTKRREGDKRLGPEEWKRERMGSG